MESSNTDIPKLPEEMIGAIALAMIMKNFPRPENQSDEQWVMYCIDLMYRLITREFTQSISQEQIGFNNPQIAEIRDLIESGSRAFVEKYKGKIPIKVPPNA